MSVEQQEAGGFGTKAPSMNGATKTLPMNGAGHHDIETNLREALRTAGVGPIELIADGQVHRFDFPSDKCGRKSGWYVLYDTGVAVIGSWKDDITHQVIAPNGNGNGNGRVSKATREKIEEAKRKAAEERKRGQAEVADFARKLWETAQPVRDQREHPYLVQKNIQPHGVRMRNGNLCIPMRDVQSQKIVNLQVIRRNGAKRFLPGGQAANCYFPINDQGAAHAVQLYIAEGFATAATVHEATRIPTTTAFNAGNLLAVARALHERYPTAQIVICADDDRETKGNPGLTKGTI